MNNKKDDRIEELKTFEDHLPPLTKFDKILHISILIIYLILLFYSTTLLLNHINEIFKISLNFALIYVIKLIIGILISIYYVDFISGLIHIVLDNELTINEIPFLKTHAILFQSHHLFPHSLSSIPLFELFFSTSINGYYFISLLLINVTEIIKWPMIFGFLLSSSIIGISIQWLHEQTHSPNPLFPMILTPKFHQLHHETFDRNFNIVNGISGSLTNFLYRKMGNSPFVQFFVFFIFYSIPPCYLSFVLPESHFFDDSDGQFPFNYLVNN